MGRVYKEQQTRKFLPKLFCLSKRPGHKNKLKGTSHEKEI